MICITSDIHHMSLKTGNQSFSDRTEASIAYDFVRLLQEKNAKLTCFITGKAVEEEWEEIGPICKSENVEVGGHTYHCFMPELWHRGCKKILGSYNGPRWQQDWDIAKTHRIIQRKSGIKIRSWRNHMYMHGPYTEELLVKHGIVVCCDGVSRDASTPKRHKNGLYNFPINIIPDHEHLFHAERTPEWVDRWIERYKWSDDYGSESYYFKEWFEIFKSEIIKRESVGVVSHILIHPITIYLCGGMQALKHLATFLGQFETTLVTDFVRSHAETDNENEKTAICTK